MNKVEKAGLVFFMVSVAISIGLIMWELVDLKKDMVLIREDDYNFLESPLNETKDIIYNCAGMNVQDTGRCLNRQVKEIYKYNVTDDSVNMNFTELKERGGDCKDWHDLYSSMAIKLGFNSTKVRIHVRNNTAHAFTIISDEEGYCLLDQRKYFCFYYGG